MNRSQIINFWLWRIEVQLWQSWWWIILALIAGAAVGQAIGQNYPDQKDWWHAIGIVGGVLVGILIGFQVWKRSPEYKISRGDTYLFQRKYETAIEMYSSAIRDIPRYPIPFNRRAIAYQASGDLQKALADFSEAIRLKSNFAKVYHNRAGLYLLMQDYTNAASDYTIAIDLNLRTAGTYMGRAAAHYWLGKLDLALADLAFVVRLKSDSADVFYLYGKIYQDQNKSTDAAVNYQKALTLKPDHRRAAEMRQYLAQQLN